MKQEAKI